MNSVVETDRLILREWRADDLPAFAQLNADPQVMQFMPKLLDRDQSNAVAEKIELHFNQHGFGLWAVEIPGIAQFAGFVGLSVPDFDARFTPCVEIGWRIAHSYWNQGYATQAAEAVASYGFSTLNLTEIVSFTVSDNLASRRVMEKLRMTHDPADDFDHPLLNAGRPLSRHVLYRLTPPTTS